MKSIYDALTGIEAHMIKNLLAFNEIKSEVFGEHLQGGVGDLQAIGIVRVMISEHDYERAREIIRAWEDSQPPPEVDAEYNTRTGNGFGSLLFGFIIGAVAILSLTQTNIELDGIDYNGDGELEEKWKNGNM